MLTISGYGEMYNYTNNKATWEKESIKNVVILYGVTSIGDSAFSGCRSLTSVTIPDSVKSIGDYTFSWCIALKWVVLPNHISEVGDKAFYRCNNCVLYCADNKYVEDYAAMHSLGYVNTAGDFELKLTPPAKTEYCIGDALDLIGMILTAAYDADHEIIITQGYEVSGFNSAVPGEQTVTITYKNKSVSYTVFVAGKEFETISVAETSKKKYYVGDEFDYAGTTVILHYNDGETTEISAENDKIAISGFDSSAAAENQIISVTYKQKLTAEFTISIVEPEKPLTNTTYRKVSNNFRFHVEYSDLIDNAVVAVSIADKTGKVLGISSLKCDGDDKYTLNIPVSDEAVIANIFTWNGIDSMQPLAVKETIQLN